MRATVAATPAQTPDPGQRIAYRSDIAVRVRRVAAARDEAIKLIQTVGGFVFSESASYQGSPEVSLSLRVPPNQFQPMLGQLSFLGTLLDQNVTAEDVTQQVTDLDGRLKTATASADRLRGLLAKAAATSDIVSIEAELQRREQEIESVQGQINAVASRVNYATINLKLVERGTAKVSTNIPGFRRGLHNGWVAFINVGKGLLTALGAVLPFLPFVVLALLLRMAYRRWRRAHPREHHGRGQPAPDATDFGPPNQPSQPPPSAHDPVTTETPGPAPGPAQMADYLPEP